MHQVQLSDRAYQAYKELALKVGLTVEEYLDKSAPVDDFVLTPEMRKGIELGLRQAEAGEGMTWDEVEKALEEHKAQWLRKQG